jgi:hypothetical protein
MDVILIVLRKFDLAFYQLLVYLYFYFVDVCGKIWLAVLRVLLVQVLPS